MYCTVDGGKGLAHILQHVAGDDDLLHLAGAFIDAEEAYLSKEAARETELRAAAAAFIGMWNERVNANEPGGDLISMLAHGEATRNMGQEEYLGNCFLLFVGGNDTMRNSISGGLLALSQNPDQYRKLPENPHLVETMVPEIIRYQMPLSHMRRTALQDTELGGKQIKKGDRERAGMAEFDHVIVGAGRCRGRSFDDEGKRLSYLSRGARPFTSRAIYSSAIFWPVSSASR